MFLYLWKHEPLPFDQKFRNFRKGVKWYGNQAPGKKIQKIRKMLNFQKSNHLTKNSGNSGMKVKWNRNFHHPTALYLLVFHRLAGKCTKIYNECRTIVRLFEPLVLRRFCSRCGWCKISAVVVYKKSRCRLIRVLSASIFVN